MGRRLPRRPGLGIRSLEGVGTMDFAGGLVVHANAGIAALVVAKLLGARRASNDLRPPL